MTLSCTGPAPANYSSIQNTRINASTLCFVKLSSGSGAIVSYLKHNLVQVASVVSGDLPESRWEKRLDICWFDRVRSSVASILTRFEN